MGLSDGVIINPIVIGEFPCVQGLLRYRAIFNY